MGLEGPIRQKEGPVKPTKNPADVSIFGWPVNPRQPPCRPSRLGTTLIALQG